MNTAYYTTGYTPETTKDYVYYSYGIIVGGDDNDIYYPSTICMYHDQGNQSFDGFKLKISNIIDIETSGTNGFKVDMYKYDTTGCYYTSGKTQKLYGTPTKRHVTASFSDNEQAQKEIAKFAYLLYETSTNAVYTKGLAIKTDQGTSYAGTTNRKLAIGYTWINVISNYIGSLKDSTGVLLDPVYTNDNSGFGIGSTVWDDGDVNTQASEKFVQDAENAIANILEDPEIELTIDEDAGITIKNGYGYIGPLTLTYAGGTITEINVNENTAITKWAGYTSGSYTINNGIATITSGTKIYLVVNADTANTLSKSSKLEITATLTHTKYKVRILLSTNKTAKGQDLMFYAGQEVEVPYKSNTGIIELGADLSIQKQDASGNALKAEGIVFEVYKGTTLIGTLTTNGNGCTSTVRLNLGTTYTIKEKTNTVYGYKHRKITSNDVSIGSGAGTISVNSSGVITITITEKTTINIKNTQELANLAIKKEGTDGEALAGVGFIVEIGDYANDVHKYIELLDSSESRVASVTGAVTINSKNKAKSDGTEYGVAYTTNKSAATTFVTDSTGSIIIRNLEVNQTPTAKYNYTAYETSNPNYGYGSSENLSLSKKTSLTLNATNKIEFENTRELANIGIEKVGTDGEKLENVQFVIQRGTNGYIQLKNSSGTAVSSIKGIATINSNNVANSTEYHVEYVSSKASATIFITDENGAAGVNNVEVSRAGTIYTYTAHEIYNPNYGYGTATNTSLTGTVTSLDLNQTNTIEVENTQELANIEIEKTGEDEEKLENVEFVIKRGTDGYLQLKDSSDAAVSSVKGTATINSNNIANSTEYHVEYVSNKASATIFITDENGAAGVNNVEVSKDAKACIYTAYEVYNPNYGYGSITNTSLSGTVTNLTLNQTTQIPIANTIDLGNLSLEKYDEDNTDIKLENVGFAIEISPSPSSSYAYLALYDQDGNIVPSIKGTATINRKNVANATEYEARYYYTNSTALELSEEEKANITIFETESDGTLAVNNLEVYKQGTETKYTYKLIEISNSNYGFIASGQTVTTTLEANSTVSKELSNKQVLTKISGYVWIENQSGKSNNYNNLYDVYTEENQSKDIILTDLYLTDEEGNVTSLNQTPEKAKGPVEIKLYNKKTGKFIKTQPDEFDTDGKYTFTEVNIEELENYQVVFKYNGFYYTTTIPNIDQDNGSKVKEVEEERTDLNSLFGTVKYNNEVISTENEVNTVTYSKDEDPTIVGHESTVSKINFDTTITANTTEAGYNLKDVFDAIKAAADSSVDGVDNVNMGIVLREQPKLKLESDIYSVLIDVNDKQYTYYYKGRQDHDTNLNDDSVGVKFEQESSVSRYTRTVYSSDVQAYNNGLVTMGVSLIYKIKITNQSGTLTSVVREITNYFDSDYTIQGIGLSLNNNEIGDELSWSTDDITENVKVENPDEGKSYNSIKISLSENGEEGVTLDAGQSKYVYIKYKVSESAIKGLLSEKSTYHNATEIMSYSTYYGASTGKQTVSGQEEYFITEQGREGEIYAGIDRSSQPGNIELKLIEDTRDSEGTKILDTSNYEDDTTSAPSLILKPTSTRKISGTIFEDTATAESLENNKKLGDGIYSTNENTIDGVKVELYDINTGKIAKYSSGEDAVATMDGKGNYTFGDENVGVVPGDYYIKYTYNNESYIVDTNGNKIKNLNVNDYKSTIITSNVIKSAINNAETIEFDGTTYPGDKWHLIKEANRYSDAIDNIDLRNTLDNDEVKYTTYKNSFEATYVMEATTPVMDIGIEFTATNEAQVDTTSLETMVNRVETLENVDFGIIERPDANMIIEKQITGLEITTQTGTNIVPKGDPSNPNASMQYVKTGMDGVVPAEIESKLLQGATLNLEYSITVTNACQIDYEESDYYLYGTGGVNKRIMKVKKVVDYLDDTMSLDTEKNGEVWTTETTAKDLYDNGYISEDVYKSLTADGENFYILITEEFYELENPGDAKTVKLYATKYLATSSTIEEENHVEVIELSGGRTIKESIPGNYDPVSSSSSEPDDDKVELVVVSPTGTTVSYELYIIAVVVMLTILVSGIVIIKKKIVR